MLAALHALAQRELAAAREVLREVYLCAWRKGGVGQNHTSALGFSLGGGSQPGGQAK